MFEETIMEGFKRGFEYEVTNVQKKREFDFARIIIPSPDQANKISTYKISLDNEVLDAKFVMPVKLTEDEKAKKNALILIAKNLNKVKNIEKLHEGLKEYMDEKNVVSVYFRLEGSKYVGTCNVQCLNAVVYK